MTPFSDTRLPRQLLKRLKKTQISDTVHTNKLALFSNIFFRYCLKCCHENEFFIQKATGWALRQHYRLHPGAVKKFVKDNDEKLAPLSKREALKHA